jgi:type I restriction enzyme S subunit
LGKEAHLLTGFPFKSKEYIDSPDGIRLLRGDNIAQGTLRWENAKRWPLSKVDGLEEYYLRAGDVVLAMDRPWIEAGLKYASVTEQDLPCLLVQRVSRLRGGNKLDTGYLRYLIGSKQFTNYVLAVQTGTAVPHISGGQIKDFEFWCPPLPEQLAIARILGSLDDKIELNRRMNKTLESIAQALFRSWFVDFEPVYAKMADDQLYGLGAEAVTLFPDRMIESEFGAIPEGWDVASVKSLVILRRDRVSPSDFPDENFYYFSFPAYDEGKSPKLEVGFGIRSSKYLVPSGSVLLARLNPRFPKVWMPSFDDAYRPICSTEFLVTMPRGGISREYLYALFSSDAFFNRFGKLVTGTSSSHQRVRQSSFLSMKVVIPPEGLIEAFTRLVKPIYRKVACNRDESKTLAALRDTLLPQLISGEMRVPEAVQIITSR